jgi:sulfonate transport system ATP-binding protein
MLVVREVDKSYGYGASVVGVLRSVSLQIHPRELVVIIGPSGSGKSTLLRLIAGLDRTYDGEITLGGEKVKGPGRDRGLVFQEHRLMPWLRVTENVAFGLKSDDAQRARLVQEFIERVGLAGFERAYPHQLSGGMAQRAALARALVNHPDLLLLDEPFGALDSLTRTSMQEELTRLHQFRNQMTLLVTHDLEEAVFLADRVLVMSPRPGTIESIVPIALPRPRDRLSPAFSAMKSRVHAVFSRPSTIAIGSRLSHDSATQQGGAPLELRTFAVAQTGQRDR